MIYTKTAAKRDGYTHEGIAYGIPVWAQIGESEVAQGSAAVVNIASKFTPFDLLLPIIDRLYMAYCRKRYPQTGIVFPLLVKEEPI